VVSEQRPRKGVGIEVFSTVQGLVHFGERSVGTVFQLPSSDTIYSREEEKDSNFGGLPDCLGLRTAHMLLGKEWWKEESE
jgi:hypothetical protein